MKASWARGAFYFLNLFCFSYLMQDSQGSFSHSACTAPIIANYYVVYPRNTLENHPPTEACMIHSGVQNSGPWDLWQASD